MAEVKPMLLTKRGLPKFAIAAAVGVVLAVLGGLGGVIAALAGTLAQPAFALAWSWRRVAIATRTRSPGMVKGIVS